MKIMKRLLVTGLAILSLATLLTSACSSGSDSKAVETLNIALTNKNTELEAQVKTAQADLDSLRTEINASKVSYDSLQAEINASKVSYGSLQAESEAAKAQLSSLTSEYASVKAERDSLRTELDSLQAEYKTASGELKQLETSYQSLLKGTQQSTLRNPTWQELKTFVSEDDTDTHQYVADQFDCSGFAIGLRDQAWRRGFRSAYIEIGFGQSSAGHALDAFQTQDKGLIYVDNTERDQIAYLEKGKIYGLIALDGVKEQFIDCSASPDDFWKPITYARYSGNIFGYGYYQNYSQRSEFHKDSQDAYNSDVKAYNAAVVIYNSSNGGGQYSSDQLEDWLNKLNSWSANLDALWKDLGSGQVSPMDAVSTIETYWD